MTASRTVYRLGLLLLVFTAIGWGLNWTVMKIVLRDWPPLFARGVSGLLAAGGMMAVAAWRGERIAVPRDAMGRLVFAAAINVFAWMGFTSLSLKWLNVAEGALLAYSMPIWATLLAWPLLHERPGVRSGLALLLGVTGIAVLMGNPGTMDVAAKAPGIVLALAAAILFALGTVTARKPIPLSPLMLTAWQVGLGCLPMIGLSLAFETVDVSRLSALGAMGLAYMTIVPMTFCYLTWFAALRRLPTATAATGMLLVPIVGTLTAALALGEAMGLKQVAALALTLSGVALALRQRKAPAGAVNPSMGAEP